MKPLSRANKLILVIIIIIFVSIAGAVGFVLILKHKNNNTGNQNISNANIANINISNINTSINISSWQTYRNEELGFEVKYPEGWYHVHDTIINAEVFSGVKSPYPDSYYGMIGRDAGLLFLIGVTTAEEILAEKGKEIIRKEDFQINNIKGEKIYSVTKYPSNPPDYYIGVYLEYGGKNYAIEGSLGVDNMPNEILFNAFLSSLILIKNN